MTERARDVGRRAVLALPLVLATTGLASGLAGCGVLPINKPPPRLYSLSPKSTFPGNLPVAAYQLGIDTPTAPAALATAKIAANRDAYRIDYFADAVWVDDAPNMVQRLLIESFDNSDRIVGVGRESVGLRANFVLRTELREFQAEYESGRPDAPPTVRVAINTRLVQLPRRVIIAVDSHERQVRASSNRMDAIVESFDLALGRVFRDIVVWTLTRPETRGFEAS